jgi:hypothetical protein
MTEKLLLGIGGGLIAAAGALGAGRPAQVPGCKLIGRVQNGRPATREDVPQVVEFRPVRPLVRVAGSGAQRDGRVAASAASVPISSATSVISSQ